MRGLFIALPFTALVAAIPLGAGACGSTVYSPGLPDSGSPPTGANPTGSGTTPTTTTTVPPAPTAGGDCVGKSCPIPLVAGIKTGGADSFYVESLAIDGSTVFVALGATGIGQCYIGRVAKLGGNLETVYQVGGGCRTQGIGAGGGLVYVAMMPLGGGAQSISTIPQSGGMPTTIYSSPYTIADHLTVGDALYFASGVSQSDILKLGTTGGQPQTIQPARPTISSMAISGTSLFWLEETAASTTRLARATTSPSAVTYVATGLNEDAAIAASATDVFWTDFKCPTCAIHRAPIQGGTETTMPIPCTAFGVSANSCSGAIRFPKLATDATDVVVAVGDRLYRVPL